MKSTGIIRRIDELGRIVIPKEIRKSLRINEGENLEIYINNDSIVLKKFSSIKKISDLAGQLTDVTYSYIKKNIIIADNNSIIAVSGPLKKEIINENISTDLSNSIKRREKLIEKYKKDIAITDKVVLNTKYIINSIISNSDVIGIVMIIDDNIDEKDFEISNIIADFIGKYNEC